VQSLWQLSACIPQLPHARLWTSPGWHSGLTWQFEVMQPPSAQTRPAAQAPAAQVPPQPSDPPQPASAQVGWQQALAAQTSVEAQQLPPQIRLFGQQLPFKQLWAAAQIAPAQAC
jgi:hypothetical protein